MSPLLLIMWSRRRMHPPPFRFGLPPLTRRMNHGITSERLVRGIGHVVRGSLARSAGKATSEPGFCALRPDLFHASCAKVLTKPGTRVSAHRGTSYNSPAYSPFRGSPAQFQQAGFGLT